MKRWCALLLPAGVILGSGVHAWAQCCSRPAGELACNAMRAKVSARTTVVAFGDSTTAPRESIVVFAERLEGKLGIGDRPIHVINAGVPGNTTRQGRDRFLTDVVAKRPDFVTILFGINDSAVDVFEGKTEPRVPLREYQENLRWMIAELRSCEIRPILLSPNPVAWTEQLRKLYSAAPYRPEEPDGWNVLLKDYAAAVRRIGRDESIPVVDTYGMFESVTSASGHSRNELTVDGMHPNNTGHELLAKSILRILRDPRTYILCGCTR
jgi:lysophospholipase L1-like esterase